ncbi:SDR family NAD(P)-dependent oxidoreductase, partial [Bacillus subtilis]
GIGKAASMELAKRGAIVAVNYSRSQSEAEETVEMIQKAGGQAFAIQADVSKNSDVQDMIQAIVNTHGTVDVLVNNASITRHIPMDDLEAATEDVWDELYAVNVKGMFFCARAV